MTGHGGLPPRTVRRRAEGAERRFADLDGAAFPPFRPGSVWLTGAGPGAPGLLTLLAYHALTRADVIVHDALVGDAILTLARPGAALIHAGKRGGKPSPLQDDISATLIREARAGHRVLRLKGGDPFMFGRGGEEAGALAAANVPFRIVPGISAGLGGLAYAGVPVTHRDTNQAVAFLTGHDISGALPHALDFASLARIPVLVLYMAVRHLPAIADALIAAGRAPDDAVAVVSNATMPSQSVTRLRLSEARTQRPHETPAIVVIGQTVPLTDVLSWFDPSHESAVFG